MSFARFFRHGARNGVGSSNGRKQSVSEPLSRVSVCLSLSLSSVSDGLVGEKVESRKQEAVLVLRVLALQGMG